MGDARYRRDLKRLLAASDRVAELKAMDPVGLLRALAAASSERDPYLANIVATELEGRLMGAALVPNASPRRIIEISPQGTIAGANPSGVRFLRHLATEAYAGRAAGDPRVPRDPRGASWADGPWWAGVPGLRERATRALERAYAGEVARFQLPQPRSSMTPDVEVTLTPVRGPSGRVGSVVAEARELIGAAEAEARLHRRERTLHEAERLVSFGSWEYDVEVDEFAWSEGLLRLLGLDAGAPTSMAAAFDVVHPADRERVGSAMSRAATHGVPFDVTFRIIHARTGDVRWLRGLGAAIRSSDGRIERLVGAFHDITETKERQERLRRAQLHARNAERIGRSGSWEIDLARGPRFYVSEGTTRMLGVETGADMPGAADAITRVVHPDDVDFVRAALDAAFKTGEFDVTFKGFDTSGELRWFRSVGESTRDEGGRIMRIVGAVRDITDEKLAQAHLESSRRELEEFVDSLTTIIAELAPSGAIKRVGAETARAAGVPPEALVGKVWQDASWWAFDPDVHERVRAAFARAAAGERVRFTSPALAADGIRILDNTLTPVTDEAGVVASVVAEARDVTEEQRLKDALTAERARLARANADLMAFNYTVSHDLRSPVRGVEAYTRALLEDHHTALPPAARALLTKLSAECSRMSMTISDLLALATDVGGEARRSRVDLSALAHGVAQELRLREPERSVDVRIEPGMVADADVRLVRILLQNLVGNAWKFTRREPAARIEVGSEGADGSLTYFVRDNGVGFDPKTAHDIFQPFRRLPVHAEFEGTGVGLATVRRIVDVHHGRVWATSTPGAGATFYFTLGAPAQHSARASRSRSSASRNTLAK